MRGVRVRGRIYNRSKKSRGGDYGNQHTVANGQNVQKPESTPTHETLGERFGVSGKTVQRDGKFAEKVEIARRIEEALAGRNHRPKEVGKILPTYDDKPQGKSADLAAESVGWSGETYRKAKAVVDSGPQREK